MKRIAGLDGIRALAISLVLVSHFYEGSPEVRRLSLGHWGVMIFFILSGFLVSRILIAQRDRPLTKALKNFFMRRALRIFPLYYLSILIFSMMGVHFGDEIWYHLTYTTNFFIVNHQGFLAPHFWSLAVEEQFYVTLPFVAFIARPKSLPWFVLFIFLTGVFFRIYYTLGDYPRYDRLLWSNTDALGLGILLALTESKLISTKTLIILALAPIATAVLLKGIWLMTHFFILALTTYVIYMFWSKPDNKSAKALEWKPLKYLGTISYGLYVWHYLLWQNKDYFTEIVDFLSSYIPILEFGHGYVLTTLTATVIVSVASYELFEKPLLKLKRYFV